MGVGMIVIMAVIMRVLFKMFVMMLVRMIVVATTATAATTLLLMRLMVFRFQIEHFVMVLMRMIVAAAAIVIMMMVMPVSMIVIMRMAVVSVVMMMTMMTALIVSTAFWLEGTLHCRDRTAEPAQHFDQHMILFDIDRVRRHFRRRMAVTDVPCGFHQSSRIFGTDFDQLLRRGFDRDEATVFKLQRIAIVQHCGLIEIEKEFDALLALERDPAAMAAFMIERDAIDQFFCLHGRLTDCLRGAEHRNPHLLSPYLGDWRGRCQRLVLLPATRLHDHNAKRNHGDH
jgi:hypothetical protein